MKIRRASSGALAFTARGRARLTQVQSKQAPGLQKVLDNQRSLVLLKDEGDNLDREDERLSVEVCFSDQKIEIGHTRDWGAQLYFLADNEVLYFATSEILLSALTSAPRALEQLSVVNYLWRGRPYHDRGMMYGVGRVPINSYISATETAPVRIEEKAIPLLQVEHGNELVDGAFNLIGNAVQRSVIDHDRIAVMLSGGVDSSLLAAISNSMGKEVVGYTLCFENDFHLNEIDQAQLVSEHLEIENTLVHVSVDKAIELLGQVLSSEVPISTPTSLSNLALVETALSDGNKKVLSGLGADECFGGYTKSLEYLAAHLHFLKEENCDLCDLYFGQKVLDTGYDLIFPGIAETFPYQYVTRNLVPDHGVISVFENDLGFYRSALRRKPLANPLELMAAFEFQYRVHEALLPAFSYPIRTSQNAVSYPFLEEDVYFWAASLDPGECFWFENNAWWAKKLLRELARHYLPEETVMRKRHVFLAPFGLWLRSNKFRSAVLEEVADSPFWGMDLVSQGAREEMISLVQTNEPSWSLERDEKIWSFLSLCGWTNRHASG